MTVMGNNHEWSYLRLNGKNYHVDPTYVLSRAEGDLFYFLMTDARRCEDGFEQDAFTYASNYSNDHPHPDYQANDKTFDGFRNGFFDSMDHEHHILNYISDGDFGETQLNSFDYAVFAAP